MSFIEIKNLSHVYHEGQENELLALNQVSLNIEAGEFVAILGTNGSGKSTLAKHINGLLLPTQGQCLVAGLDTANSDDLWQIRQKVGMVFQNPDNQLIAAVVEDDVAFGPENLGMPPTLIRKRVNAALKAVNMQAYRSFAPHLLSGGQKQRVAIAGALAMQTSCVIFDEATAMLDPQGRDEVMTTIRKLHDEQQMTTIIITHFMEEAAYADKIIVMNDGKIVKIGTPTEIFSDVTTMRRLGLDVPLAVDIADDLQKHNIKLSQTVIDDDSLLQALEEWYGN